MTGLVSRVRALDPLVADGLLAALLAVAVFSESVAIESSEGGWAVNLATSVVMCAPLAWRRIYPIQVIVGVVLGALLQTAFGTDVPDTGFSFAAVVVASYSVGAHAPLRGAIVGLVAVWAGVAAVNLAAEGSAPVGDYIGPSVFFGLCWAMGRVIRTRVVQARELREKAQRLEHEREARTREAVAEERARIARELHDIVAHSVSVMVVQSGGARRLIPSDPDRAREALEQVEATGREALTEMRRMLGVLRKADEDATLTPQPSLDHLDVLVGRARDAGLPVDLRVDGSRVQLAPGVDLVAYRVVQEALTNSIKHAGASQALVHVHYGPRELELEISDDGRGPAASAAANGAGHGLIGMRERVSLYGGRVETGAGADGGFRVLARLPYDSGDAA
jgi:signal transduction histidine kinase